MPTRHHTPMPATPWYAICLTLLVLLAPSCRKPELEPAKTLNIAAAGGQPTLPTITTAAPKLSGDTLDMKASVQHGSSWITEWGFCIGPTGSITLESNDTILPVDVYDYDSTFQRSLFPAYQYVGKYLRAYATNGEGTGYGEALLISGIRVITNSVSEVEDVSARVNCTIDGDANGERGVWFSSPTLPGGNYVIANGAGPGPFHVELGGLTPGTNYHARAFARNENNELVHGDIIPFRTNLCPTALRIGDNTYPVVEIAGRCWMAKNLSETKYSNGQTISVETNAQNSWWNFTTGGRCAPGENASNVVTHGWLYNSYAAIDANQVCPAGWEVPSHEDWQTILNTIGPNASALMAQSWNDGANSSGFSALPAGERSQPGFEFMQKGAWWSRDTSSTGGIGFSIRTNPDQLILDTVPQEYGRSIRCIKSEHE